MPHVHIEYSDNLPGLDGARLLSQVNRVLVDSGQFEPQDIKSRIRSCGCYLIGLGEAQASLHLELRLLSGRLPEVRRQLSAELAQALTEALGPRPSSGLPVQVSVDVVDMDRASYSKRSA